jgi:nucleoside-diphosphate-sugar epimerase
LAAQQWQTFATSRSVPLWRFRLAGIYGPTRNALYQLRAGTARHVVKEGQVFNRIHVIDVARAIKAAFDAPALATVLNICDDEPAPPQDVIAFAAELLKIPPPQSIPLAQAYPSLPGRSFFDDNKRVSNELMKQVLHVELRYSGYRIGLRALLDS